MYDVIISGNLCFQRTEGGHHGVSGMRVIHNVSTTEPASATTPLPVMGGWTVPGTLLITPTALGHIAISITSTVSHSACVNFSI